MIFRILASTYLFIGLCTFLIAAAILATFGGTDLTAKIFTSPFFYPVYGLLALNFIFAGIDHLRSARRSLNFVYIHLGALLVLGGASYGHFTQFDGVMRVFQDSISDTVYVWEVSDDVERDSGQPEDHTVPVPVVLPFKVWLERFWIEYYPEERKSPFYLVGFLHDESALRMEPDLRMRIEEGSPREVFLRDFHIRVEEILWSAEVEEEPGAPPELVVEMKDSEEQLSYPIEIGKTVTVEQLNARFTPLQIFHNGRLTKKDGKMRIIESSEPPPNPALEIMVESPLGAEAIIKPLFAMMPSKHPALDGGTSFQLRYRPAESLGYTVSPAEGEDGACAVRIAVTRGKESVSNWYFLNHHRLPGMHSPFDGLSLRIWRPPRVKDYKSKVNIIEGDEIVSSKLVEVNHPLSYKGYTFYQTNYDKEELKYSEFQVVRDPGVWWVMTGFLLIMFGVIQKFYLEPLFSRKAKKGAA